MLVNYMEKRWFCGTAATWFSVWCKHVCVWRCCCCCWLCRRYWRRARIYRQPPDSFKFVAVVACIVCSFSFLFFVFPLSRSLSDCLRVLIYFLLFPSYVICAKRLRITRIHFNHFHFQRWDAIGVPMRTLCSNAKSTESTRAPESYEQEHAHVAARHWILRVDHMLQGLN